MILNNQYESLAIGLMLNNEEAAFHGINELDIDCFQDSNYRILFNIIKNLIEKKKKVDIYNVDLDLKDQGQIFSFDELLSIEDKFYLPEKFQTIIDFLKDRKKKIGTILILKSVIHKLDSNLSFEESIENLDETLNNFTDKQTEIISGSNYLKIRTEHDQLKEKKSNISTFYPELDELLTYKLALGSISIIGARPSNGKSAFKSNLISNMCSNGIGVGSYALEQTILEESDRLESLISNIPLSEIANNNLWSKDDDRWGRLMEARNQIKQWNYYNIPGLSKSFNEMRSELKSLKKAGVSIVFWDLVDRMKDISRQTVNKAQMISNILQQLLEVAQDLEQHYCLLVQINRKVEGRKNIKPTLADLKESGSYEEIARTIFLLHYPGYYDPSLVNPYMELDIAKQSHGPRKLLKFSYDNKTLLFSLKDKMVHGLKIHD